MTNQCNEKQCHWIDFKDPHQSTNRSSCQASCLASSKVSKLQSRDCKKWQNSNLPLSEFSHHLNDFKCFQTLSKPKSMHSFRNLYVTNPTKDTKAKRVSVVSTIEKMPTRHRLRPVLGTSLVSHLGFVASKVFSEFLQGNCRRLVCL